MQIELTLQEFVSSDNPDIRTQRIECEVSMMYSLKPLNTLCNVLSCRVQWFQIKRKLPCAGRYDLQLALEVYLWRGDLKFKNILCSKLKIFSL